MIKKMLDVVRKSGDTLLISGPHGIGKSEMVKEYAMENNMHCVVLLLSHQEVGDLIGMPITDEVNQQTIWLKPSWFVEIEEKAKMGINSVLFIDELNRGSKDVRDTALSLVLDKKLHTHVLPRNTMIVAAVNPSNSGKYQVAQLDPALTNRFLKINVDANATSWLEYAKRKNLHHTVISFIAKNEDKLFFESENGDEQSATPRSWTMLSENLKVLEQSSEKDNKNLLKAIIIGKIGTAIGGQFFNYYLENSKLLDTKDIVEEVNKLAKKYKNLDIQSQIEKVAEDLKQGILVGQESIQLQDLINKMVRMYHEKGITKEDIIADRKVVLPLSSLMYAVDIELAASIFKENKGTDHYDIIVHCDVDKKLCKKIVDIKFSA